MLQQRGGVRIRSEMRMLRLRVMQLRAGWCTLHHHWDGRWPGVDRCPATALATGATTDDRIAGAAAAIAAAAAAERFMQVLTHLIFLFLHYVITRWILQECAHLNKHTHSASLY